MPNGTVLAGRYRIDGVLGAGGMGRVYRGEHTSMGKPVAIKVLHAALGKNPEAAIRFQREAIASGRLDHPNIVSVMDFGVLEDGCLFMVMEMLEGEHLGQRLERDKVIAWPEALSITRDVLLGLRHAHDRGVVHRDIKPDNIFLANKDGERVIKILDFGIAKLYAGTTDNVAATRAGLTVGTPTYLSPEQAVGGAITPASDLYSTSIVLYEMLCGRPPFENEDPIALLTSHAGAEVPPFRDVAPMLDVPDGLEALVHQGLAKFAAERIGSALDYVHRIDELMRANGFEVATPPPAARVSASMGIPVGPYGRATPTPSAGRGALSPSPDFLATPGPFPAAGAADPLAQTLAAPVPAPSSRPSAAPAAPIARGSSAGPAPAPRRRRRWLAGAFVIVAGTAGAAAWSLHDRDRGASPPSPTLASAAAKPAPAPPPQPAPAPHPAESRAVAPHPAPPHPAPPRAPAPHPVSREHEVELQAALHTLDHATTCAARKKAIPKLVALHDAKALTALHQARVRKTNACLRASAEAAIRALGSR